METTEQLSALITKKKKTRNQPWSVAKKKFRITPLGHLAVALKFDKPLLAPATRFYETQMDLGREPSIGELINVTKQSFPHITL